MKVCFITETLFNLGGVQRVISVLANELSKHYEIEILCVSDRFEINRSLYNIDDDININVGLRKNNIISKVQLKIIKEIIKRNDVIGKHIKVNILKNIYYPVKIQQNLIKYINEKQYDVVIGAEGYYSVLLGIISNKIKARTIGWQHSSYDAYLNTPNQYCWKQDRLFEEYLSKLDCCVVLTEEDKKRYKDKLNIDCTTIYNPLSFNSVKKSECCKKNILFVGRLLEQTKGLDLLIKAIKQVIEKRQDWTLTIVGEGQDKQKLIDLINKEDLNKFVSVQAFTNNIEEYYINASIFLSTSRWEGFGLVITEAMECGLPVISFANSGPKEIINKNGINGILVAKENIDELVERIIYLIDNKQVRQNISKNAIERARDFNIQNISNKWISIIENHEEPKEKNKC